MKKRDIKIPVAWGHQPDAWPADASQRATQQYYLSAFNAGYLDDMRISKDGSIAVSLDCPGCEMVGDKLTTWVKLPDGRQVRTAIAEVSAAIKDWKDGQGKVWDDSIVHVALTPLPVAHGTGGFRRGWEMSVVCTGDDLPITLSLATYLRELSTDGEGDMAEDKEKPDKGEGEDEGGSKSYFKEGLKILAGMGLSLPDDTDEGNFWERVCVAGHALEAAGAGGAGANDMDMDMDMGDEMPPEMPEEPAPTEDMGGDEGVSYSGEEDEEEGSDVEESRPVMMSLTTAKNRSVRKGIEREQNRHRGGLKARIERLVKRGLHPKVAKQLQDQVEGYALSLTSDWEVVPQRLDERIGDLELSLPASHPLKGSITGKGRAREAPRPDIRNRDRTKQQNKIGEELAALAGYVPARKDSTNKG